MSARLDRGRLWRVGAVAGVVAVIVNLLIFGVGRAAGVGFVVPNVPTFGGTSSAVGPVLVVVITAVWFVLGLLATMVVASRQPRRLRTMQIVATVITVLSLAQPLTADADTASRVVLATMHPVTGAAFVLALGRVHASAVAAGGDLREHASTSS